jgi:PAS domain S-box-containing protein
MCASGLFVSARRERSLLMTTESITSYRTTEASTGVRFVMRRQYNSAWPEAARSRLAGSSDSTMNTNDGSRAPLELRSFIDSIRAFAWSARPDGFPEFVNQRLQDYSGLSPDQLYGDWKSILHRDEVEDFEKRWQGLQNSGKPGQTELRLRRFDGEYRWFQISAAPIHDDQGNLVRWCGINTDIDDRKRAEQKLKKNEEDLRTIIDAIRQAVVVLTPDGATLYANRVALDITGLTMSEVNDNSFLTRASHPDNVDRIREERQERLLVGPLSS